MATCKDCILYDILCGHALQESELKMCNSIKNKSDVVEVKHGEWQRQKNGFYFLCSVCGKAAATKGNYCHNCGAKMDGGRNDG